MVSLEEKILIEKLISQWKEEILNVSNFDDYEKKCLKYCFILQKYSNESIFYFIYKVNSKPFVCPRCSPLDYSLQPDTYASFDSIRHFMTCFYNLGHEDVWSAFLYLNQINRYYPKFRIRASWEVFEDVFEYQNSILSILKSIFLPTKKEWFEPLCARCNSPFNFHE